MFFMTRMQASGNALYRPPDNQVTAGQRESPFGIQHDDTAHNAAQTTNTDAQQQALEPSASNMKAGCLLLENAPALAVNTAAACKQKPAARVGVASRAVGEARPGLIGSYKSMPAWLQDKMDRLGNVSIFEPTLHSVASVPATTCAAQQSSQPYPQQCKEAETDMKHQERCYPGPIDMSGRCLPGSNDLAYEGDSRHAEPTSDGTLHCVGQVSGAQNPWQYEQGWQEGTFGVLCSRVRGGIREGTSAQQPQGCSGRQHETDLSQPAFYHGPPGSWQNCTEHRGATNGSNARAHLQGNADQASLPLRPGETSFPYPAIFWEYISLSGLSFAVVANPSGQAHQAVRIKS